MVSGQAGLAEEIRGRVLARLSADTGQRELSRADQRQLLRSWVEQELASEARRRVLGGEPQLDRDAEVALLRAVENTIWGLGRLQQLLDLPDVEDIHIVGAERPLLRMVDGSIRRAPESVADSDADLIAQLQYVAAHHAGAERAFSPAQPCLTCSSPTAPGWRRCATSSPTPR